MHPDSQAVPADAPAVHPNIQAVQAALLAAGVKRDITVLPDAVSTAAAAAAALGISVGQIANSLIFNADDAPLLVLTSGAHRVDTVKVAALIGATKVNRATPEFVREHTGQAIGGVSPVGHPGQIRTLVDVALAAYDEIWAAGGIPHAVFPITYPELVQVTAGTPAEVA